MSECDKHQNLVDTVHEHEVKVILLQEKQANAHKAVKHLTNDVGNNAIAIDTMSRKLMGTIEPTLNSHDTRIIHLEDDLKKRSASKNGFLDWAFRLILGACILYIMSKVGITR